jgi:hypothetical protein
LHHDSRDGRSSRTRSDASRRRQLRHHPARGRFLDPARKSKTDGGYTRVQFDLRNGAYLRQTINVSFEWLAADGTVTESQPNWIVTPLEPGALTTVTATALKSQSAECRLRLISR